MYEIKLFILGFIFIYFVQLLDIAMQILSAYSSVIITKYQVKINELGGNIEDKYDDSHRIGFHIDSYEDEYEIDGDYID